VHPEPPKGGSTMAEEPQLKQVRPIGRDNGLSDELGAGQQERAQEAEATGDGIEEELDKLDEMIDVALELGDDEEEAERRAQEFVDAFEQEGGE